MGLASWSRSLGEICEPVCNTPELPAIPMTIRLTPETLQRRCLELYFSSQKAVSLSLTVSEIGQSFPSESIFFGGVSINALCADCPVSSVRQAEKGACYASEQKIFK